MNIEWSTITITAKLSAGCGKRKNMQADTLLLKCTKVHSAKVDSSFFEVFRNYLAAGAV